MDLAVGRSLVRRWRSGGNADGAAGAPRPAATSPQPAPLSTNQHGILVFERLHPGTAVFNVCFAARHTGPLTEDRLDAAIAALVDRHPALRSTFIDGADGEPRRVVHPPGATSAEVDENGGPGSWVTWTDVTEADVIARLRQISTRPFDLQHGPLVRVHALRLDPQQRVIVFVGHHLVCDGVSQQLLMGELDAAYRGELSGPAPDPIPPHFDRDALGYWRDRLSGVPELELHSDRGNELAAPFSGGSVPLSLDRDLTDRLSDLARSENATLFMVLLAGFELLLAQHSGQSDFAVGVPHAGRTQPPQHNVVGLLSDLLLVRADLSGRPTFRELLRRVRDVCLGAFDHRDVPFENVVAALAPGRSLDGALVQVSLVFHGDRPTPELAGAPLVAVPVPRPGLRYAVELHLWREQGRLLGSWDYNADAFEPVAAARLAARLPVLLSRALTRPDQPLALLDPLTSAERDQLAVWGRGPEPDDPDLTVPDLFAGQVARTPDAVAVQEGGTFLTYAELDRRSNQLAHALAGRGIGPGDLIGICMPRSPGLLVTMMGILKVGAAYLPLDPAYPTDRLDYMQTDCAVREVLEEQHLEHLTDQPDVPVPGVDVRPDNLGYVLYTSGSTGRPKGVRITQRNLVALLHWARRAYSAEELSAVLASTSVCFDVSAFELYAPLCVGGTVVIVDNALALLTEAPAVTLVCMVPTAARALVAADALPHTVRVVGLAGEPVPAALVADLYAIDHIRSVVNLYGPTEDTTYSSFRRLARGEAPPPIGTLLPHGYGYVLDGALRQVPIGAVGELYLAGRGLTEGYHGRPGLTAGRFVANPFRQPGERMYRTGDSVRYRSDGELVYVGRRDLQVKVRGQRIELEEIESTIEQHPGVRQAVVLLRDDRLVGYLTGRGPGLDLDDVRAYLRRTLPVVMVPASLVALDVLPQLPNGKVDRKALPEPDAPALVGGEPPRGPDEQLVAAVWRDVLELDEVGRDDDFFDLGGDSLLAGHVLGRLRERAGGGLPLRLVFENSRLADLAAAVAEAAADSGATAQAGPEPSTTPTRTPDTPAVLSFDQERIWLESMVRSGSPENTAYNLHGRRWLRGRLNVEAFCSSIVAIVDRHEILRSSFPVCDGRPVQQVHPATTWSPVTVTDLTTRDPGNPAVLAALVAQGERAADAHAGTVFNLADGPLFAVLLQKIGETDALLSITLHHLVADGWSIRLFLRELSALYRNGGNAVGAGLPGLPLQYRDHAAAQRERLRGRELTVQLDHWRRQLAGAPTALNLPTARRRAPGQGVRGDRTTRLLEAAEVEAIGNLARNHEVTVFMVLLAAFAALLSRWSGQRDVVIGVPVDTRRDTNAADLIGLFVNTVPMRLQLTGDPSFAELVRRAQQAALFGYVRYGDTPLDELVRGLDVPRDPTRSPIFQVLLGMVDEAEERWQLPGVQVEDADVPPQPSKLDLDLSLHRRGDHWRLELISQADRYDPAAMTALLDQFAAVLRAAAADPGRPTAALDVRPADADRTVVATEPDPLTQLDLDDADRVAVWSAADPLHELAAQLAGSAGATLLVGEPDPAADRPLELPGCVRWLRGSAATVAVLPPALLRAVASVTTGSPVLPRARWLLLANAGDLLGADVELARRIAPRAGLVTVTPTPGGPLGFPVPAGWGAATAPLRIPYGCARRLAEHWLEGLPVVGELAEARFGDGARPVRLRSDGLVEPASAPGADPWPIIAALRDLPEVGDAVVTADPLSSTRPGGPGPGWRATLACPGGELERDRLQQHLTAVLPADAIPVELVVLPGLPLTAAGKYASAGADLAPADGNAKS